MTRTRSNNWLNQALRQAPWRTQTQATSLVLALVVIVVVIGALYLAEASRTAAAGRRLQELDGQRQTLEQKNAELRAEIAALRSVPRLVSAAQQLGYRPATSDDVEYLPIPDEAPQVAAPAPPRASSQIVAQYDETLASWLSESLASLREPLQKFLKATFGPDATPK
jgi:type VI protein secretion system component VasK